MVKKNGFAGLTLDYEGLKTATTENYRTFVTELAQELGKNDYGLNVLVEPSRGPLPPSGTARLIVMAYNLHGPRSGPGPRALRVHRRPGKAGGRRPSSSRLSPWRWEASSGRKRGKPQKVSWQDAFRMAQGEAEVGRNSPDACPFARWPDHTEMWFEDPASLKANGRPPACRLP